MNHRNTLLSYKDEIVYKLRLFDSISVSCVLFGEYGKTVLLKSEFPDIVIVDSREITDLKSLIGFYAIKDGNIAFIDGILTHCLTNGKRICFKNIDHNNSLLDFLRPVFKNSNTIDYGGKVLLRDSSFRIYFTSKESFVCRGLQFVGNIGFNYSQVLELFGDSHLIVENVINFILENRAEKCDYDTNKICGSICLKKHSNSCFKGIEEGPCFLDSILEPFGNSKHFKQNAEGERFLCKYHFNLFIDLLNYIKGSSNIETDLLSGITNLFLNHETEELSVYFSSQYPRLKLNSDGIVDTKPTMRVLRSLINDINHNKPSLLVGETGAGKTTLIQYLARNSQYYFNKEVNLKVLNMSSDIDMNDLIGGYESIDIDKKISELAKRTKTDLPIHYSRNRKLQIVAERASGLFESEILLYRKMIENKIFFVFKEGLIYKAFKEGHWILLDEVNLCSNETLNFLDSITCAKGFYLHETQEFVKAHPDFRVFASMNPGNDVGKKDFVNYAFNTHKFVDFSSTLEDVNKVVEATLMGKICDTAKISNFFCRFKTMIDTKELSNILQPLITGRTLCRALKLAIFLIENGHYNNHSIALYKSFSLLFFTQLDFQSKLQARSLFREYFDVPEEKIEGTRIIGSFVITPQVSLYLSDIELALKFNLPLLLQGDTSTGKTTVIYHLSKQYSRNIIRINNHENTEVSDYLGTYMTSNGGIFFKEGALIRAMQNGDWIILDELNLAPSEVLEVLNRLLDDNREIFVAELNKTVKPHPNFRIFATQNLNYSGRKKLPKSFRNRFIEIYVVNKTSSEIKEILEMRCKIPDAFSKRIIGVYDELHNKRSLNTLITLRDLYKWCNRGLYGYPDIFEKGLSVVLERQRSDVDNDAVISVFENVFSDKNLKYANLHEDSYKENLFLIRNNEKYIPECFNLTKSYIKLINLIDGAWRNNEPVLLVGETGIGKTKICELMANIYKSAIITINMHSGIDNNDFIGYFTLEEGKIKWEDGPLVRAMESGSILLIDEINLGEDSVLERLNSVLEDQRTLFVPELNKNIVAHPEFKIFATMNPGGDFGKRELSPALKNRFTEVYFDLKIDEKYEIFKNFLSMKDLPEKYLERFGNLGLDVSVRKLELITDFLQTIHNHSNSEILLDVDFSNSKDVWNECLDLINMCGTPSELNYHEDTKTFGVYPYTMIKSKHTSKFSFDTNSTSKTLKRIFRGFLLDKAIMLEGDPGVGKTSVIQNLANILNKKCIRVNLSDQTELSDLLGSFVPQDSNITFSESTLSKYLRNGDWIILDEVNLCTQSVIEGLNSILDFRKEVNFYNTTIKVHPETKIFATLNPSDSLNGRKGLPKSFLDRFIRIKVENYTVNDIKKILDKSCGKNYLFDESLSLRENLRLNKVGCFNQNAKYRATHDSFRIGDVCISKKSTQDFKFSYIPNNQFYLNEEFVLIHSQIHQVEMILKCIIKSVPIILTGEFGRSKLLEFVSTLLGLDLYDFYCNTETDISDLFGQFVKKEDELVFYWKDSSLIKNIQKSALIVFNNPELVEKAIFDRLNSLFEDSRTLDCYEKGIDTLINVHPDSKYILYSNNIEQLSPALIDRCCVVELSKEINYCDIYKIFIKNKELYDQQMDKCIEYIPQDMDELAITTKYVECNDLSLECKKFDCFKQLPTLFTRIHPTAYNSLIETTIDSMFQIGYKTYEEFDKDLLDFYKDIKCQSVPFPSDFNDMASVLETQKSISLVKCLNYKSMKKNLPLSLYDYKIYHLEQIKNYKISDLEGIVYFNKKLIEMSAFELDFNLDLVRYVNLLKIGDPLVMLQKEITNEYYFKANKLIDSFKKEAISAYKYGKGQQDKIIDQFKTLKNEYEKKRDEVFVSRDIEKFLNMFKTVCFCDYFHNEDVRNLFEEFCDISDYILKVMYALCHEKCQKNKLKKMWQDLEIDGVTCEPPFRSPSSYMAVSQDLIQNHNYNHCLMPEYSKYFYNIDNSMDANPCELIFESILLNDTIMLDCGLSVHPYSDEQLNTVIKNMVPKSTRVLAIETRNNRILLGSDFKSCNEIADLDIMCKPEHIINFLNDRYIQNIENNSTIDECPFKDSLEFLKSLYTKVNCLEFERNYKFYIFFVENKAKMSFENFNLFEKFFLDSTVFEFLDKMFFAKGFLGKYDNPFLYNLVLLYKSYGIEELDSTKIKKCKTKIRNTPKYVETSLDEYISRFLMIPVTSLINISFPSPGCVENHPKEFIDKLSVVLGREYDPSKCLCLNFINFSKNIDKTKFSYNKTCSKDEVLKLFFSRSVQNMFDYSEICLAKVMNKLNELDNYYDLVKLGIEHPFPPFLYLLFTLTDNYILDETEGCGLKGGEGLENIEDVNEEDIDDDVDNTKDKEIEDEGKDMDNGGDTCSVDEEDGESAANDQEDALSGEQPDNEPEGDEVMKEDQNNECEEVESSNGTDAELDEEDNGEDVIDEAIEDEEGSGEEISEGEVSEVNNSDEGEEEKNELTKYEYKEQAFNLEQTCDTAVDYENTVPGGNSELALQEGEGPEKVKGDEETGSSAVPIAESYQLKMIKQDCSKLANSLKVILESNRNSKYKGDYKSGKKLNMKRLVPYIASDFKKDKIWLKRNKKDKNNYIIRVFIDNSKSMSDRILVDKLSNIYSMLEASFANINIPVELYKFGSGVKKCTIDELYFDEDRTNLDFIEEFTDGINIILTDGILSNIGYSQDNFLVVMIDRRNIKNMSRVVCFGGQVVVQKYLDLFHLPYCVVEDVNQLETIFINSLRDIIKYL